MLRNETLSLLSILSLIAVFAVVCAGALFALWRLDAFEIPWRTRSKAATNPEGEKYEDVLSGLCEEEQTEFLTIEADELAIRKKIVSAVSGKSFFMRCDVFDSRETGGTHATYDLWNCGDKYRVIKYDAEGNMISDVICDGTIVNVNYAGGDRRVFTIYEANFGRFSPLPDLSFVFEDDCKIIYRSADDNEYEVICEYGEDNVMDMKIQMSSGLLSSVKIFKDGQTYLNIECILSAADITEKDFLN